jgi:hypothetical protein
MIDCGVKVGAHGTGAAIPPVEETVSGWGYGKVSSVRSAQNVVL